MNEPIDIAVDSGLRPLMPKFLERRTLELAQMKEALVTGDIALLERIGHILRGSSGGYGFDRLGEIGTRIEAAAKARDAALLVQLVAEVEDHLGRVRVRYV